MIDALEQFRPHQEELRKRILHIVAALVLASAVAYLFKDQLASWCMHPLYQAYPALDKLVYTKLTEAFISYIKLALLVGLIVSFPYILYQIWLFIAPGLLDHEQQSLRRIILWSTLLFAAGGLFAFFVVLPMLLHYFLSYATPQLQPMLKLGLYLTFTGRLILAFAIAFEIPFLMVMSIRTGLLSRQHFSQKRLYFACLILVLAFLLSAGDLTATALVSIPLFLLYETGIIAGRLFTQDKTP